MDAAVIKLDTLTDTVRTAAQDHDLAAIGRIDFGFFLVGRIHVSRICRELPCTGIHALVNRANSEFMTTGSNLIFFDLQKLSQTAIGEAFLFEEKHFFLRELGQAVLFEAVFNINEFFDLNEEPRIDLGSTMSFFDAVAQTERIRQVPKTIGARFADFVVNRGAIGRDFI
mgnify:CR=1 FL=1